MGYTYEQSVKLFGKEAANRLFGSKENQGSFYKEPDRSYLKKKEDDHGKLFHEYLETKGLKHTHIGNESGQSGTVNIIIMMKKKKALGVSSGYPDYHIQIPTKQSHIDLHVELKKAKGPQGGMNGSEISFEQIEWHKAMNDTIGNFHHFCHGSNEAISIVEEYVEKFRHLTNIEAFHEWEKKFSERHFVQEKLDANP